MSNTHDDDDEEFKIIAYTGDDATRAGSSHAALRQTERDVGGWIARAGEAAQRAQDAARVGAHHVARIEATICEICTHEALRNARQERKVG
jgi:hypothetical protein